MDILDGTELRTQLEEHHASSFGWALNCCSYNDAEAKDVLQTAYLKILDGRARFKGQSSFKTWLFSVIRNTAADERRRRWFRFAGLAKFAKENTVDATCCQDEDGDEASEMSRWLKAELDRLSKRQQEILHLVFYQEMTLEMAAEVMGVSLGSARTHYERGKHNLRKSMADSEAHYEK